MITLAKRALVLHRDGGQADQRTDVGRAAQELQLAARQHPALGMPDDIYFAGAGCREYLGHEGSQLPRGGCDLAGALEVRIGRRATVVEREDAVTMINR